MNARNVTLNPENCPTFAKMAYQFKWRNVTLNPANCPTFAQMGYQYKWSTEC